MRLYMIKNPITQGSASTCGPPPVTMAQPLSSSKPDSTEGTSRSRSPQISFEPSNNAQSPTNSTDSTFTVPNGTIDEDKLDKPFVALSDTMGLDFEHEKQKLLKQEQKLKSQLALFEQVEEKKAHIKLMQSSMLDLVKQTEPAKKALYSALLEIKSLETDLVELQNKYEARKEDWTKKMKDGRVSVFDFSTILSRVDVENLDQLKITAQLAAENASLIKERLDHELCTIAIAQTKLVKVAPIETQIKMLCREFNEQFKQLHVLMAEETTLVREWTIKWSAELRLEQFSTVLGYGLSDDAQRATLQELIDQTTNGAYERGKQDQASDSAELLELEKSKWEKIAALNEQNARHDSRDECYKTFVPLIHAGIYVRERKLEWISGEPQNEKITDLGNRAAHYGMVLADASLYQHYCFAERKREKTASFVELYGVEPDFIWARREAVRLVEILDWRAAMKDFHRKGGYAGKYGGTKFNTIFLPLLSDLKAEETLQSVPAINQYFLTHDVEYQALKMEHAAALEKHKAYFKASKR